MVKVKKNSLGVMSGKVGDMRYYEVNGEMIASAMPSFMTNPRSPAQMKQRIKMNNILNMYKYIKGFLQQNFEGIVGNKNASSFFRSYNLMKSPVWLTQQQKQSCRYVLAPYVVSQGRITSVDYAYRDGVFVTDINIGNLEISENTEECELAGVIAANNEGWMNNDTLQVMVLRQKGIPSLDADIEFPECFSVVLALDKSSRAKLVDAPMLETLSPMSRIPLCNIDGKLALSVPDSDGYIYAFAVVHGRGSGREKLVSSQQLCLSDNVLHSLYCGEEAFEKAFASYK